MKLLELLMHVCPELVFFMAGLFILIVTALCLWFIRLIAPREMWNLMWKDHRAAKPKRNTRNT